MNQNDTHVATRRNTAPTAETELYVNASKLAVSAARKALEKLEPDALQQQPPTAAAGASNPAQEAQVSTLVNTLTELLAPLQPEDGSKGALVLPVPPSHGDGSEKTLKALLVSAVESNVGIDELKRLRQFEASHKQVKICLTDA